MIDGEALAIMASTAVEGIQHMANGRRVAVLVIIGDMSDGQALEHAAFRLNANLTDEGIRIVCDKTIATLDLKEQRIVGSA